MKIRPQCPGLRATATESVIDTLYEQYKLWVSTLSRGRETEGRRDLGHDSGGRKITD